MSICRVFPGRADASYKVRDKIHYLADTSKNIWQGISFVGLPGRLKGYMLPDDPDDLDGIYHSFMAAHWAYGDVRSNHRLFYHVLLDFGGLLAPEQAVELGWQAAMWFRQFHVQYLQGLHCVRYGKNGLGPVFQPHVHWITSTRMLDGSGKKLHLGKSELKALKMYANGVLAAHSLPLIVMKKGGS